MPLRLRWALSILGAGALVVVVIVLVNGSGESQQGSAAALLRENRKARRLIGADQAPRSAELPRGVAPPLALEHAIAADLRGRVRRHDLRGPAQVVRCSAQPPADSARVAFRCTARAGGFPYPFRGVVDRRAGRLTWCKFDPAPAGEGAVPLSPRCK